MERQFVFTNELKFFEIKDKGQKRFFVKGVFSSTDLDLVNDICTQNCLESMVKQIKSGNIKMDFEHEAFLGETKEATELAKTRLPLAKAIDAKVEGTFAEATWELNENYKKFDSKGDVVLTFQEIKQDVERKFLSGFSIAYIPTEIGHKTVNGEQIRLLNDVRLLNVALTGNPVNTVAQVRGVFMKSMDAVEEYKKEKKNNPDLSNQLEVKAESGSDREKRKIRKEATEEEEDEEETKRYGKKKEKKAYEKDGAHAHTEDEPLGLHNHPEIEMEFRRVWDFIFESNRSKTEEVKSQSKDNSKIVRKEVKNMEDNEKEETTEEAETTEEKTETTEASTESKEEVSEPLSEVKSMFTEVMKELKSVKMELVELKAKDEEEVKAPEVKVNSKAVQTQTQGIQAKSAKAGLSELG